VINTKRPISERKLQANRANAKRSTGPKTAAGKAASRRNALKHGIRSCLVDLPMAIPGLDRSSPFNEQPVAGALGTDSDLQGISRIREKLARIVILEQDCAQRPDGIERNSLLIWRYERMLTNLLHAHIREWAGLERKELEVL
jgi:hypothetical protein